MTKLDLLQASFNAGELSPRLHARVDFVKYPAGLEECINLIPLPEGGVARRPGTRFVAEVADSSKKSRLFSFEATADQHHVLELGENIIRFFFRQGQQVVLDTDAVITNGLFTSNITDWDDRSTGGGSITHDAANGRLNLFPGGTTGTDISWAEQGISTSNINQEHVIRFEVIGDPGDRIEFQVGTATILSDTLSPVENQVGFHCVAFTPTVSPFFIQFRNVGSSSELPGHGNKTVQIDNVSFIDNTPLEIASPYTEAQLFQIMGAQSNDLKYLFRQGVTPYKLERRALASWSLVKVAWQDGPYITQNSEATTLNPAAAGGVANTVTASSTIGINGGRGFLSTDVGRLVRIDNDAEWGWGIIVSVTSTTVVDVHVKKNFAATTATAKWRLGAWSDTTGWPKTGGFFEQRLYVASTDDQSQTLWGSQTGDFENFKPDDDKNVVEDDDALNFTLSADSVGEIRWLSAGEDTLAIGTAGGEWVPSASGIVITPLDITIRRQTTHGSALIAPLRIDHVVLFVQKAKRKVREFVFNFEFDSFLAPDLTRLAQHITAPGVDDMAFQQEPDSLVWAIRGDGKLLSLTFRRDEDVVGWARHDIGGKGSTGSEATFSITGGSSSTGVNTISSITVDGVEILPGAVDWAVHDEVTVLAVADSINSSDFGWDLSTATGTGKTFDPDGTTVAGLEFKPDGLKMYVPDTSSGPAIVEYDLGTAWEVDTAVKLQLFDYSATIVTASHMTIGKDGTRLYILDGNTTKTVYQFNLSVAWDITSAVFETSIATGLTNSSGIKFSAAGDFFGINDSVDTLDIIEYSLSSPWEVNTAVKTLLGFSATTVGPSGPWGNFDHAFGKNGTRLFVARNTIGSIYQYTLSTAYRISTATYDGVVIDVDDIDGNTEDVLQQITFKPDGTVLFFSGKDLDIVHQFDIGPPPPQTSITASFNLCSVTVENSGPNLRVASYDNVSFDTELSSGPSAITFSTNGAKMYLPNGGERVRQYNLSTPYDLNTASFEVEFHDNTRSDSFGSGLEFSSDGTKIFSTVAARQTLNSYTLSTPWDISTIDKASFFEFLLSAQDTGPLGVRFKPDGTKFYIIGTQNDSFYQYTLSTPYDLSTAVYDNISLNITVQDNIPTGLAFNSKGTKLFLVGAQNDSVYQYTLSTSYDLNTASYDNVSFSVASEDGTPAEVVFSQDDTKMYMAGAVTNFVYQYSVSVDGTYRSACGATITISQATPPGSVIITTTGDVTVDNITPAMSSTGVSLSESVVTILGNDGSGQVQNSEDRDEVWVTVQRTINGETKRYVEFFEGYYDDLLHDQEDAYYADSIITYDDVLTDTITGLSHLEGETVKVWGDGAVLPDVVVANGQVTLSIAVKVAQIGLAYKHRLKTLKIEGGSPIGTAIGQKKRINGITFVLLNSHTISFGRDDNNLFKTDFRLVSDPMDAGAPLFTGEQFREFDGNLTPDARIIVESDDPAPFTLLAMVPEVKVMPAK